MERHATSVHYAREAVDRHRQEADALFSTLNNYFWPLYITGAVFVVLLADVVFSNGELARFRKMFGEIGLAVGFVAFPLVLLRRIYLGRKYMQALTDQISAETKLRALQEQELNPPRG